MRALVAVVDAGGFTAAAATLGMSQPAVSHAIAALEAELGVMLLDRGRTGVRPTTTGQRVVVEARAALAHVERLHREASGAAALTHGTVRVGAFPSVAARLLPRLLSAFGRRYPGIELTLQEGTDDEVREWLRARAVDVGVVTLPADGWATVRLAEDELCAVVPAAHALASAPAVRADHLAEDPFVMSLGGCETLIRAVLRANGVTPRVKFAVRDVDTVLALVAEGLGVTVVPALALPAALPNVAVLPLEPPVRRRLALAVRSRDAVAPAVAAFLDLARGGTGPVEPRRRGDAVGRPDRR